MAKVEQPALCDVAGCQRPRQHRDERLCGMHHKRVMRHGSLQGRSVARRLEGKSIPEPNSGCYLWLGQWDGRQGYGRIEINHKVVRAHRAAWEAHHGRPVPEGKWVLHKCDVTACVNPLHLFLGDASDNVADMVEKGRQYRPLGELHKMAKLSDEIVAEVRRSSLPTVQLAEKYGVVRHTIGNVRARRSWGHLP